MSYIREPYSHNKNKIKFELDFPNYTTKSDLKSATDIDISKYAKKDDLASLKSDVDKLDIDKSETLPVDLSKPSNVVKNNVVEKTLPYILIKSINAIQTIDTSHLVKKADYNTKIVEIEKKKPDHDKQKKILMKY